MAFNNIFEVLTTASDISQFVSLHQALHHSDKIDIMKHLDEQDDIMLNKIVALLEQILEKLNSQ